MKKSDQLKISFLSAAGVLFYVGAVAWFMTNAQAILGGGPDTFLAPVFMLLLFIISASLTGLMVLGKPTMLYLDGAKKEAFMLLFATIAWLAVFLFIVAAMIALI